MSDSPGLLGGRRVLFAFSLAAVGAGTARGLTTSYLPVLLDRIDDAPSLIGVVMSVNAIAGFAVPLAVGLWSDRRAASGLGRRLPFMIGGSALAAGGLVAVGLGSGSSYVALGLAAAVVYVGLNALTTAHRALVADDVADERRPAATSGQEIAMALGAGLAVGIGGALIDPAPGAAFAFAAAVLVASAVPTLVLTRRLRLGSAPRPRPVGGARASLAGTVRRPGAREVLIAQTLWVFAYAALPAFFVLYAENELGLGLGAAGTLPLAFGIFIAVGMILGGRTEPDRVHPTLVRGAALLATGLLIAGATTNLGIVAAGLVPAALGAGLVTSLGFPYFARFVPAGEAGGYSGAFFAGRGIASALALPLAGVSVEVTGSYRSVLLLGGSALIAIVPLVVAERRRLGRAVIDLRPRPARVAAVIPVFGSARAVEVASATLQHVDELVLVDDGAPAEISRSLAAIAGDDRVRVVTLDHNGGKGTAVAAGVDLLLQGDAPEAVVVLDSDAQHDPERIPAFVEAARAADVVIGSRRDRRPMPVLRRLGNRAASLALLAASRRWIPDTQNGMRLFRTDALRSVPFPTGGFDAESRHLRALLAEGRRVDSVEVPTIYEGEPSGFRPLADSVSVGRALIASPHSADGPAGDAGWRVVGGVLREWSPRLGVLLAGTIAVGAALPALQPLDNATFLAINHLGDGPEWLYQALDPHTRNYIQLFALAVVGAGIATRRLRYALGAGVAIVLAGYLAGVALEFVKVFVDRPRPEEVLDGQVWLSHARDWSHIASYPSGHLIVTTALATVAAAAAPRLRSPLIVYVAAVGFTRILFGAHFPLDVVVGAVLGYEVGMLAVAMVASAGLLPAPRWRRERARATEPLEEPVHALTGARR
ncbi:MAG TPA: MFS transporter [Solirubrobacterales bacterium]|jgi:dolichol-phosphate mannosyltransferase|nr:MFS transporter [Solirubrobacterales bacterium]